MSHHPDDTDKGFDLRQMLTAAMRWKAFILVPLLIGGIIGYALINLAVPTYTATAVLVLDARKVHVVDFESVVSRLPQDAPVLRSELDIILSRSTAARVAQRIQEEGLQPPLPPTRRLPIWSAVLEMVDNAVVDAFGTDNAVHRWLDDLVPDPVQPELAQDALIDQIMDGVRVSNDGRSYTIKIYVTSRDAAYSAKVANLFAEEYLSFQTDSKSAAAREASEWLSARVEQLRKKLEESELALEQYRAEQGMVGEDSQRPEVARLGSLTNRLTAVQSQRLTTEAHLRVISSVLGAGGDIAGISPDLTSDLLVGLREQQAALLDELNELTNRTTENHPMLVPLQNRLDGLKSQIEAELRRIVDGLEGRGAVLETEEEVIIDEIGAIQSGQAEEGRALVRLRQLEREADANKAIYGTFLNRFKQMIEQVDIQRPDARMVTAATPPEGIDSTRNAPVMAVALLGGLFIGSVLVFLREHFDRTLRKPDDIEAATGLPVLGVLPEARASLGRRIEDLVLGRGGAPMVEALRAVQITLRRRIGRMGVVVGPAGPCAMMVTSAVPREGKSTFALCFARMLASDGRSVLLLDADLRATRLPKVLGVKRAQPDLIDLLMDRVTLNDAVHVDPKTGLHYLGARARCANPQAMLSSDAFQRLSRTLRETYDWVIIDTPPVGAVPEAALVAEGADVCLYVVRGNSTRHDVALSGLRTLDLCNVQVDGVIVSRVPGWRPYGSQWGIPVRRPAMAAARAAAPGPVLAASGDTGGGPAASSLRARGDRAPPSATSPG